MTTSSELLTNNQPITINLASLASGAYQQSAAIDNTSNQFLDAGVQLSVKTGGSGVSATGTVNVYAYASANGGANYTDGASGNNASFNPTSPTNLKLIGVINANGNSQTFTGGPFSVSQAFGYLPGKWGIVVWNNTGAALDATESNHLKFFEALKISSV
ncbi:MAG: hypothetical protein KGI29_05325 [Pseudomonadota bacterium]|nr:hypothetical protein [Pseudomonadota bacterium]MDE3037037.1 hypothetical protein [Pseudomonadota bacterium]